MAKGSHPSATNGRRSRLKHRPLRLNSRCSTPCSVGQLSVPSCSIFRNRVPGVFLMAQLRKASYNYTLRDTRIRETLEVVVPCLLDPHHGRFTTSTITTPLRIPPRTDNDLRRALTTLKFGDALWWIFFAHRLPQARTDFVDRRAREPGPIYSYKRVRLGDVGYIRRGRFHLLFSAGVPLGSRELGVDVPVTFEPLSIGSVVSGQTRPPGYLRTDAVQQIGVDVGGSGTVAWCVNRVGSGLPLIVWAG